MTILLVMQGNLFDDRCENHLIAITTSLEQWPLITKLLLSLLPKLSESKGQVINISAINVFMAPAPYWAAYQASKTAFDQWFQCAVPEMQETGVSSSSIYLPLVKTRMIAPTQAYRHMPAMTPEHVARIIAKSMITKRQEFKPWWSFWGELGSVLFRKTWRKRIAPKLLG